MATQTHNRQKNPQKSKPQKKGGGLGSMLRVVLLGLLIVALVLVVAKNAAVHKAISSVPAQTAPEEVTPAKAEPEKPKKGGFLGLFSSGKTEPEESPEPEETPEPTPTPEPEFLFEPYAVESTKPENLITMTEVQVNGELVESYASPYAPISFEKGSDYTALEGIVTFRGDNFRSGASYGVTEALTAKKFGSGWEASTGSLQDTNLNVWTGSGWTGQPLVVRWPKETRAVMTSMKDWAREQDDLVEVIYATMDGYIYFTELETGKATRDRMNMGLTYKGAGALDPRGYPILYVGSGVRNLDMKSHVSVINLITCEVMYTFGDRDSFALRDWPMFDSSAIVDAETDQLIYPGENGLVYIIHLNTKYDPATGELSIDPDNVVKWRYQSARQTRYVYWLGMESSCVAYKGYLFLNDNGGHLMCLDLNTLQLVWVQDILDDSNCSPVLDLEDGHPYLYVSTSFHYGWRAYDKANIPIWKIDAVTGEIVWQVDYECYTDSGISGGVQGTLAIDDRRIYVPVAKTGGANAGLLVAIDKQTGEKEWEFPTNIYSWGSPIRFDDTAGGRYLIYNTGYSNNGYIYLMNADTGEVYDSRNLNGNVEASGVVFENTLVIGHRSCRFYGIPLT